MNINKMLKQAQQMQKKMQSAQAELAEKTVESTAGGGKVTVVANGGGDVISIKISPDVIDPDDVEMLEDLVAAAINDATQRLESESKGKMSGITDGMNLPAGFKMPF